MISLRINGEAFLGELRDEIKREWEDGFLNLQKRIVLKARDAVLQNAPEHEGFLKKSTAVSIGQPDKTLIGQTQGQAEAELERLSFGQDAFLQVNAFYASFQENGTAHQPARPFFDPAVELVRDEVA